jgi:hypothetical protein
MSEMTKLFLASVAALSVLSASAAAEPDPKWEYVEKDQTFYLGINHGGLLNLYIERWKTVAASGDDVEIRGPCPSACTLVMVYVPKARICFGINGMLGFHLARNVDGTPAMDATWWMFNAYPEDIRAWLQAKGGVEKMSIEKMWYLDSTELWKMGYRNCNKPKGNE